jgi:hypothetical protein
MCSSACFIGVSANIGTAQSLKASALCEGMCVLRWIHPACIPCVCVHTRIRMDGHHIASSCTILTVRAVGLWKLSEQKNCLTYSEQLILVYERLMQKSASDVPVQDLIPVEGVVHYRCSNEQLSSAVTVLRALKGLCECSQQLIDACIKASTCVRQPSGHELIVHVPSFSSCLCGPIADCHVQ